METNMEWLSSDEGFVNFNDFSSYLQNYEISKIYNQSLL